MGASFAHAAATYTVIYTFPNNGTPQAPQYVSASSLVAKNGTLYGTTRNGGDTACSGGCGTLFKLTTQGALTTLYSFTPSTAAPVGVLPLLGSYYVSEGSGFATISATGALTRVVAVPPKTGSHFSPLSVDGSLLAGAALEGGLHANTGSIFTLRKSGTGGAYKTLYAFTGGGDGAQPVGAPVDVNGTLYGATTGGGPYGTGVFYSVTSTGTETVLATFLTSSHGLNPTQPIYVGGKFYFTTAIPNPGAIYSVDTAGNEDMLYKFTAKDGEPSGNLAYVNGTFYGPTSNGLYTLDSAGDFKMIYTVAAPGPSPTGPLVAIGGSLYGIATTYNGPSVVYQFTP